MTPASMWTWGQAIAAVMLGLLLVGLFALLCGTPTAPVLYQVS